MTPSLTGDELRDLVALVDAAQGFFFPKGDVSTPLDVATDGRAYHLGDITVPLYHRDLGILIGRLLVEDGYVAFDFLEQP